MGRYCSTHFTTCSTTTDIDISINSASGCAASWPSTAFQRCLSFSDAGSSSSRCVCAASVAHFYRYTVRWAASSTDADILVALSRDAVSLYAAWDERCACAKDVEHCP